MRIKEGFVLRRVADLNVVLPLGQATLNFNGMVQLNESGTLLWHQMEKGTTREELAELLTKEYNVSKEEALTDVNAFLNVLDPVGCIEE